MTGPSQTFAIGQEVEITGPSCAGNIGHFGERFRITERTPLDREEYSTSGLPWYPASSLRLVEPELKIGDWAEIVGMSVYLDNSCVGKVFRIDEIRRDNLIPAHGRLYLPACLRKLTPGEVAKQFTATLKLDTSEFEAGIEKAQDKLWKLQVEQRFAAIEKQIAEGQ